MEFKGTKEFPKYEGGDNYSIDLVFNNGATISIDRSCRYSDVLVCSREEMEANAQLIAHAPEMLEMLQNQYDFLIYCRDNMQVSRPVFNQRALRIKNLIDKATNI